MSTFVLPCPATTVHTSQKYELGQIFIGNAGKRFVYVYNAGADSIVLLDVVGAYTTTTTYGYVSSTAATIAVDAVTSSGYCVGIGLSTIATTQYGFLQITGNITTGVRTDDGVAAGHALVMDGTTDRADSMAAGEEHLVFGISRDADNDTTHTASNVQLFVSFWG